jgi:hypothetical protein
MAAHTHLANRQRLVAEWRSSGPSAAAFARQHGIVAYTFRRWITEAHAPSPTFIEVLSPTQVRPSRAPLAFEIDGHHVTFGELPPPRWLAQVIRGLAAR